LEVLGLAELLLVLVLVRTMAELKDMGPGKGDGLQITHEQEQARVFEMLSHGEGWWHAVKENPKALMWCEYRSICDTWQASMNF